MSIFGFNSNKYTLNITKEILLKSLGKKEYEYKFLRTYKFMFLSVMNYVAPGLSYDAWHRLMNGRFSCLYFYKNVLTFDIGRLLLWSRRNWCLEDKYKFLLEFRDKGCVTTKNWLRDCERVDMLPFIRAAD